MAKRPNYKWDGKDREHRTVASETLGRPLLPAEVVHHINGDPRDNRPENLHVYASQADHIMFGHGSDLVTVSEIETLILLGVGCERIVERCRVGTWRVVRIRRRLEERLGFPVNRIAYRLGRTTMPKKKATFDWQEALALYESGETFAAIGREFNVTAEAVSYAVRQLRAGREMPV